MEPGRRRRARRSSGPPCTTPTRCGARACSSATPWCCARPATSSPRSSARSSTCATAPSASSSCRRTARRAARRSPPRRRATRTSAAPTPGLVPGPAARAARRAGRARRVRHRGARLGGRGRAAGRRGSRRRVDLFALTAGDIAHRAALHPGGQEDRPRGPASSTAGSLSANGAQALRQPREGQAAAAVAGARRAVDPARRPDGGARPRASTSRRWIADPGGVARGARRVEGVGRVIAESVHRLVRRRATSGTRRSSTVGGRRGPDGRRARRVRRADPRGADGRRHRFARGVLPRRDQGGDPRPRGQGRPGRCRRRPTTSSSARTPGPRRTRREELGVTVLDEAGFRTLLANGSVD